MDLWLGAPTCTDKVHGFLEPFFGMVIDLGEQRPPARRTVHPLATGRFAPLDEERREENRGAHLRHTLTCSVPLTEYANLRIAQLLHRVTHTRSSTPSKDVPRGTATLLAGDRPLHPIQIPPALMYAQMKMLQVDLV